MFFTLKKSFRLGRLTCLMGMGDPPPPPPHLPHTHTPTHTPSPPGGFAANPPHPPQASFGGHFFWPGTGEHWHTRSESFSPFHHGNSAFRPFRGSCTWSAVATKWAVTKWLKMLGLVELGLGHRFHLKIPSQKLSEQRGESILPQGHLFAKHCTLQITYDFIFGLV